MSGWAAVHCAHSRSVSAVPVRRVSAARDARLEREGEGSADHATQATAAANDAKRSPDKLCSSCHVTAIGGSERWLT